MAIRLVLVTGALFTLLAASCSSDPTCEGDACTDATAPPGPDGVDGTDGGGAMGEGGPVQVDPSADGGACLASGDQCTSTKQCCAGQVCAGGKCRVPPAACGPAGDTCGLASDCCPAESCASGKCSLCRDDRLACTKDGECCSGYCRGGHCGQVPNPATCKAIAFDCNGSVDNCCTEASACRASDNSLASYQCCKIAGDTCAGSFDCCGEMKCVAGTCRAVNIGASCADHADCLTGLTCIEGKCDTGKCHAYNTSCGGDAADGKGCCPGMTCFFTGGVEKCVLSIGSGLCKGGGESCADSDECCFPAICNSKGKCEDFVTCAFPGAACSTGSQCCSGICAGGSCTNVTPQCSGTGQLCGGAYGGCCSGLTCTQGRCGSGAAVCKSDGAACTKATDCCTGRCDGGVCGATGSATCKDDGATCAASSACCSGRCVSGKCTANTAPPPAGPPPAGSCEGKDCGQAACCGAAPFCTSASGGVSVFKCRSNCGTRGVVCKGNADCCSGLSCLGGECGNPVACTGKACSSNIDCCDHDDYCVAGKCATSCGSTGAGCGDDADCCSWSCVNDKCASQ